MKNIRLFKAPKYNTEEYKEVKEGVYRTLVMPNYLSLKGITDEELVERLAALEDWEYGKGQADRGYQCLVADGKKYYRKKINPDNEDQKIIYYEPFGMEPEKVFVTSIVYEPEPEYGENEPADPIVSQYPLEDILDKYGCYCLDDYKEENETDAHHSYIEFASDRRKDLVSLLEIIGKHVYNQEDGDYIKLIIE